ncbi:hypothetical protein [Endozoicomonas arenosclerae]|uniref:hypothetical protein n=1 Tax=Endozoicomonas arenosclerae TaxID=1633495 RepID=UPI0007855561|nr:hypothetical protein [Endozoicomonas arenosclerae]
MQIPTSKESKVIRWGEAISQGGIQFDSSIPAGLPGGIPESTSTQIGKTNSGQTVTALKDTIPEVPKTGKPPGFPNTDITSRKPSIPSDSTSLPSIHSKESEPAEDKPPVDEVLEEKVPRSFKKKLADAARKFKSKTYGDLKRWLLGQNFKPVPQGLLDRVSYDSKMQVNLTQRNEMLSTLAELKDQLRSLKDELSTLEKDSPRYQEVKSQIKSIPEDREALKEQIMSFNKEIEADLPRFAKVERQVKGH